MVSALFHTSRSLPVEDRISEALGDAAVSITITVLTDILSFGVGYFTDFPAVQLFCVYTCVAMFITFLYQLTFLLGLLVLHARNEQRAMHSFLPCIKTIPWKTAGTFTYTLISKSRDHAFKRILNVGKLPSTAAWDREIIFLLNEMKNRSVLRKLFCIGSTAVVPLPKGAQGSASFMVADKQGSKISRTFQKTIAPILVNPWTITVILVLYAVYLAMSIYGCFLVKEGLEPVNLLVRDSYATKYYQQVDKYFNEKGQLVQICFQQPGKLSDPENRRAILDIVKKFANSPHGMGDDGVDFWLMEFESFLPRYNQRYVEELDNQSFYDNLEAFLGFEEFERYRGDVIWNNTAEEKISAFRLAVGVQNFALAYQQVVPNVLQEMYSGMACMVVIALLLVPKPLCSLWVTFMIASIDVGVIGYMAFWNLSMDCISMITLIMSIGFSVDFSAHIAYAYTTSPEKESTVFLVILIGVTHGIVILPVFLHLFDPQTVRACFRERKQADANLRPISTIEVEAAPNASKHAPEANDSHKPSEPSARLEKLTTITKKYLLKFHAPPQSGGSTNPAFVRS
ncbi:unnamed protein product [Soboliphyme baturini]|uniref:SSD domain-containing protein n=1 Tax=Soboliphyme baturini TaxID=241478 RepID=A0A183J3Q7_9BILA|nr:unnamed protein product [Soboliphyme baturini]